MIRELNHRESDGISVTLLWHTETGRVFISVVEERHGVVLEFPIRPADAHDAFHHPFAYAAFAQEDGALAA